MKTLREMTVHTAFRFTGLALLFAAWTVVVPPARLAAPEQHDPLGRLVPARRLAADVQTAYLNEASARRAVEIYAASLALVQENERVAERLVAAGRATPEAVFRARADRSEIEQQLAEARQRDAAGAGVQNQILRRPLEAPLGPSPYSAPLLPLS